LRQSSYSDICPARTLSADLGVYEGVANFVGTLIGSSSPGALSLRQSSSAALLAKYVAPTKPPTLAINIPAESFTVEEWQGVLDGQQAGTRKDGPAATIKARREVGQCMEEFLKPRQLQKKHSWLELLELKKIHPHLTGVPKKHSQCCERQLLL
jgi:hypothetical protein